MKHALFTLLTMILFVASAKNSVAQKANTACVWSLSKMVQLFEEHCSPEERNDYRTALDQSVIALQERTRELGTVPEIDRVSSEMKGHIEGMLAKDPALCQHGHLYDMSLKMRDKGVDGMKQDVSKILAVPRERQVNGCL